MKQTASFSGFLTGFSAYLRIGLRMTMFSLIFIAPVAAFTGIAANTGSKVTATGLVLFVSLQK